MTQPAREQALALLAGLVIVVESEEGDWDRTSADEARSHGARVAAVPGPVDSARSLGSNALIADGADVIRDARDALDVLYGVGRGRACRARRRSPSKRSTSARPASATEASAKAERLSAIGSSRRAGPLAALEPPPGLQPDLAAVLERVGSGQDTLAKLCAGMPTCGELALALTELELLGLLRRREDGRYLAA